MAKDKKKSTGFLAALSKIGLKLMGALGKLLKLVKFLKFGLAAATFVTYSYLFTWKFALLLMVAIGWHESGHVWAMKKLGFKTKGFYFLPFLGGAAIQESAYTAYSENVFVAIMDPVWGLILAVISLLFYYSTGNPLFAAAASWMSFLNLFNLFPINPLDGGQIVRSIGFSIHKTLGFIILLLSLFACVILAYRMNAGLFGFLLAIGILDMSYEYNNRRSAIRLYNHYIAAGDRALERDIEYASKEGITTRTRQMFIESGKKMREGYHKQAKEYLKKIPTQMNWWQIAASIASYTLVVVSLLAIMHLMKDIPGADIAAQFMADK